MSATDARRATVRGMNPNPRPILTLAPSRIERAFDRVAIAGLVCAALLAVYGFVFVAGPVPTHFDAAGRPDAFGSKGILLLVLIPVVPGVALFAGLRNAPHTFNYAVAITPENAERQYRIARELLAGTGAGIAWTIAATVLSITGTGAGWFAAPGPLLLAFILTVTLGPVAWSLRRSYANR